MTEEERRRKKAEYMREYNSRPEAAAKKKARQKAYYEANRERWVQRDIEHRLADPEGFKEKKREAQARHRANPHNTIKLRYLNARYGLTPEQYQAMETAQGGLCAICKKPPTGRWKRLHVDHDHTTGKVRGLLCFCCNAMLGQARDDMNVLQSAMAYLQQRFVTGVHGPSPCGAPTCLR